MAGHVGDGLVRAHHDPGGRLDLSAPVLREQREAAEAAQLVQGATLARGAGPIVETPMRYLLAILLPPVGMLSVGKPFQALLCLILMFTVLGWPFASIWAVLTVHSAFADRRTERIIRAQSEAASDR